MIDFPVLGKIEIAGKNREEIASFIKGELLAKNLVKDPVVTVEYMNLCISVLGEVAQPGRYSIDRDKVTVLDAISMAGDLTIYGKREKCWCFVKRAGYNMYMVSISVRQNICILPRYIICARTMWYM